MAAEPAAEALFASKLGLQPASFGDAIGVTSEASSEWNDRGEHDLYSRDNSVFLALCVPAIAALAIQIVLRRVTRATALDPAATSPTKGHLRTVESRSTQSAMPQSPHPISGSLLTAHTLRACSNLSAALFI